MTEIVNLAEASGREEEQWGPFHHVDLPLRPLLGAEVFGCALYDVPPGGRNWPYHFHVGNEEWLLVVAGTPTLRTPAGERQLRPGDVVAFAEGPDGAHDVSNRSSGNVRVAIFSTLRKGFPEYPDAGKVGAGGRYFRVADAVDYFDGEF